MDVGDWAAISRVHCRRDIAGLRRRLEPASLDFDLFVRNDSAAVVLYQFEFTTAFRTHAEIWNNELRC